MPQRFQSAELPKNRLPGEITDTFSQSPAYLLQLIAVINKAEEGKRNSFPSPSLLVKAITLSDCVK